MSEQVVNIPEGWKLATLGEICDIDPETLSSSTPGSYSFRYIDIASVSPNRISNQLSLEQFSSAPSRARKKVRANDVLMATVRPNLKAFAKVQETGEFVASTGFAVLRAIDGESHPEFLKQLIFSDAIEQQIDSLVAGSNYPAITVSNVKRLQVLAPTFTEQESIAEVLSALDEQIEATEALISKKFLVRSAILTTLVKDAHASSVAIDLLASKVGSGVTPTGGSEVYTSSGVTFVRSQNVLNESLEFSDVAFITDETHAGMAASKLQVHDVLLNITGASIGRSCAVPEGIGEANVNQHVCIIRLHRPCKADAALLAALICSEFGQRELNRQISGGNREGLNYQQVRAMALPWPQDAAIRAEMASVIQAAKSEIEALEAELVKLQQQKQGLMHDLLSGKTRVLQ